MKSTIIKSEAKPFLKWAGGKGQLIGQIIPYLPPMLKEGRIKKYFEPFLGGGALFFWLAEHCNIDSVYLNELNPAVCLCYQIIKTDVKKLIYQLKHLEIEYISKTEKKRETLYYDKREEFNNLLNSKSENNAVRQSALLIFLNKTGFNGLYRVNSQGIFNVPFGRYKNPSICNESNLLSVNRVLCKAKITCADFEKSLEHANKESFVYLDPPYRPISKTASFTNYSKDNFDDTEQQRLRKVFGELDKRGAYVMMSNSDPKNTNPEDNYFDNMYKNYNIERLKATRLINCNANRRGNITEILVMNY